MSRRLALDPPSSFGLRPSLWCAHPRLKPGESFSSWLHRSAFANGMADHTYCRHAFGLKAIWNRDVDHLPDAAMLLMAARATSETPKRLASSTLGVFNGVFHATEPRGGHFPWILSLGVYHRLRRRHGQQYCPLCLAEGEAWLRLHWRVAWAVCCPLHQCFLRDACPRCDAPFVFHRTSLAMVGRVPCHACGVNLAGPPAPGHAAQSTVRFQIWLSRSVARGRCELAGTTVDALSLFLGLRVLTRGIFCKRQLVGLQDTLPRHLQRLAPDRPPMQIEHWRLPARVFALDVLRRTLIDWPDGFIRAGRYAGLYRARFQSATDNSLPAWLSSGLNGLRRERR